MDFKSILRNVCSVSFAVIFLASSAAPAADWPNWRGPNYDGISTESGWNPAFDDQGPALLWEKNVGIGFSAVTEADGKTYLMGNRENTDTVYCLEAATGKELWTKSYAQALDPKSYEGGTLSSPTVVDGKVYTQSKDGITLCLDAESGAVIWQKNVAKDYGFKRPNWGFAGSLVVIGDLVIMNVGRRGLALNKSDGSIAWGEDKTPGGYATPVPFEQDGKKCVAIFGFKEIIGLEAATGRQLWEHTWVTKYDVNAADPIIDGNKIFISSGYGIGCTMLKIEGSKVTELWKNKNMKNKMSGSVLIDGAIYGPDERDGLVCLDAATGNRLWAEKEYRMGALTATEDKLIVLSQQGKLAIVEADKTAYKPISAAKVLNGRCWTTPTLANGRLYVRDSRNVVKCLDVSAKGKPVAKKNDTPWWPQWQGNKGSIGYADGMLYCYDEHKGTVALVTAAPEKFGIQRSLLLPLAKAGTGLIL